MYIHIRMLSLATIMELNTEQVVNIQLNKCVLSRGLVEVIIVTDLVFGVLGRVDLCDLVGMEFQHLPH